MKKLKLRSHLLYTLLVFFFLLSCKEQKSEIKKKYTIWIGSSNFSAGYDTDSYKDSTNYLIFTKEDGTTTIYNKKYLYKIDINKR